MTAFRRSWAALILVLTAAPYFIADRLTPPGRVYAWIIPPYSSDSMAYLTWSRQAYDGALLFMLKFTALPHAPFLFNPFFLVCGNLARATGLAIAVVHLIVKSVGVLLFFSAFYALSDRLRLNPRASVIAALLVGLSSGLGGPLNLPGSPDLHLVDANTFWCLLWNPLFPYSLALMLCAARFMDEAVADGSRRAAVLCGLSVGLLALIHPYAVAVLVPVFAAACVFAAEKRRARARFGLAAAVAAAPVGYAVAIAAFHPLLRLHSAMGAMKGATLAGLLVGFAPPLLLIAPEALLNGRALWERQRVLVLWVAAAFASTFVPVWFQEKLIFGTHAALCLLAGAALDSLLSRLDGPRRKAALAAALAAYPAACWSQVVVLRSALAEFRANADGDYTIDADAWEALAALRKAKAGPSDLVYAGVVSSAKVAAYSGNTVFWGHWAQSVDYARRVAWERSVFDPASGWDDARRASEFWATGVEFLYLDGPEKERFDRSPPAWLLAGTEKVFGNASVAVYRRR